MLRLKNILLGVVALSLTFNIALSQAYGWNWNISSFNSDITIEENSSMSVKETIIADYSREQHHGIFRTIPIRYKDSFGNSLNLRFQLLSVTDEKGKAWPFTESNEGEYVKLQIGDAATYLQQPTTFVITYQVQRAITTFNDHEELYWNNTGTEWDVPVNKATATITVPSNVKPEDLRATCYTGQYGSSLQACTTQIVDHTITVQATSSLAPQEGLTTVIGLPKGLLQMSSWQQQLQWFLEDNWGYFIPFFVLIFMLYAWYKHGRDAETTHTAIMPIYTPPENLSPAEVGTLIDERVDMQDIISTIIDLAVRGYLKIIETKEKKFFFETFEYEFKRTKDITPTLKTHEKEMMDALFLQSGVLYKESCKLSELTNKFYKHLPTLKKQIYTNLIKEKFFASNPDTIRNTYRIIGGIFIFLGLMTVGGAAETTIISISVPIGVAISGVIFIAFSKYMPAKTVKGSEIFFKIKGLEEYINTAEKDRLKFQEKENIFEKLLPYAMALGLADKWTRSFEGIYKTAPNWYSSNDTSFMNNFSTYYFLSRLNHLSGDMKSTFQSSPRSSGGGAWSGGSGFGGGGFSGGGFGGGGGGSW